MDVAGAIRKRRSARHYKPDPIPEEVLNKLLDLMRLAPSAGNRQPSKFIVVRDRETREQVAACCRYARADGTVGALEWVSEAPVVVVPCGSAREAMAPYYEDEELVIVPHGQVVTDELGKRVGEYVIPIA